MTGTVDGSSPSPSRWIPAARPDMAGDSGSEPPYTLSEWDDVLHAWGVLPGVLPKSVGPAAGPVNTLELGSRSSRLDPNDRHP